MPLKKLALILITLHLAYADYTNNAEDAMRARVSRKLSDEMRRLRAEMRQQALINADNLERALAFRNYVLIQSTVTGVLADLLDYYRNALGIEQRGDGITAGDFAGVIGAALGNAAIRGENLQALTEIDVSCAEAEFDPLLDSYGLETRLDGFDETFAGLDEAGRWAMRDVELTKINHELRTLRNKFQDKLGCIMSSQIFNDQQKLVGLLGLYIKAASLRISLY